VKRCPRAREKCDLCWRKGHGAAQCPQEALRSARFGPWHGLRCAACRGEGHLICDGSGVVKTWQDDSAPEESQSCVDESQKAWQVSAELLGSRGVRWEGQHLTSRSWERWEEKEWCKEKDWSSWKWKTHSSGSRSAASHHGRHGANNKHWRHGSVPSMRIRDKPSARSVQRARQKNERRR